MMPPTLDGLPLLKPPYSRVTAIDLNRGDITWAAATGNGPREHPLLKDLNLPPLGAGIRMSAITTKSLLFVASGAGNLGASNAIPVGGRPLSPRLPPEPAKLHAYDKQTGAHVWEAATPLGPLAAPMTYLHQGTQYLVVAAGAGLNAELVAYKLQ